MSTAAGGHLGTGLVERVLTQGLGLLGSSPRDWAFGGLKRGLEHGGELTEGLGWRWKGQAQTTSS